MGFVGGPFLRFLTFYPFADKNSIVSSYFIVEKRVFLWGYIKNGAECFWGIAERKETIELQSFSQKRCVYKKSVAYYATSCI